MPPKPTNWAMYGKMAAAFVLPSLSIITLAYLTNTRPSFTVCAVGGPALIVWVTPTEEELFLKYNPELQKRSLENRIGKQEDFDHFVNKLKEYSKSDKPSTFFLLIFGRIGGSGDW
jgi:hypothetical protein